MTDPGLLAVRWSSVDAELSVCPRSPIKPNLNPTFTHSAQDLTPVRIFMDASMHTAHRSWGSRIAWMQSRER